MPEDSSVYHSSFALPSLGFDLPNTTEQRTSRNDEPTSGEEEEVVRHTACRPGW